MKLKYLFIFLVSLNACSKSTLDSTLFTSLESVETNVNFINEIIEDKETNYYNYQYLYNGGGVGIGDINNDLLPDLYFTSTVGVDKLYLNKGDFVFEDISESSGISISTGFKSGVSMVDINADGLLDIYVCRAGWKSRDANRNLLFINQGDNTFKEEAKEYGLDTENHSIQAGFLDYDQDGDLDMYLANHPGIFQVPIERIWKYMDKKPMLASDRLFRNDDGVFVDVTKESGIQNYSYSLGLALADLNNDGWTDIYVANDFEQADFYYINNGDGSFTESLKEYFPHCSYFAMGSEIADVNNDALLDLFVVEMLAEDNLRQKTNMAPMNPEKFNTLLDKDIHYQYMRNSLQLNHGNGHFSDAAEYAGVANTDWSWGTLLADFDHDMDNDILVANGFLRDTQDKDLEKRRKQWMKEKQQGLNFETVFATLNSTPIKNYAFENKGDLNFEKSNDRWGFNHIGFSNGMATGDLDGDGDLDVVVNNINAEASIYRNNTNDKNYIDIRLKGSKKNTNGLNAQVKIYQGENRQIRNVQSVRGFQSSSQTGAHFGLSQNAIDSIKVFWDDGSVQLITKPKSGQLLVINQSSSTQTESPKHKTLLQAFESSPFTKHSENNFDDYNKQVLLPHKLSQMGPALSVGDFNNDGEEDLFIGAAHQNESSLWLSDKDGNYSQLETDIFEKDAIHEDVDAVFVDVNNDGFQDLYVVSGGNEFNPGNDFYQDRLYLNKDGKALIKASLPEIKFAGSSVSFNDYDADGDQDIFVGCRHLPWQYPFSEQSLLLENIDGNFKISEMQIQENEMIQSSYWSNVDNDQNEELITVGEWTSINIYDIINGDLVRKKLSNQDSLYGWWNVVKTADLDNDGDQDIVLGNLGENYKYKATVNEPFEVYAKDYDSNGSSDIVLGYYNDEKLYPVRGFQCSSEQLPELKSKIASYEDFGSSTLIDVYGADLNESLHLKATNFSSLILWNEEGNYKISKLPYQAQLAPIMDFEFNDFNEDGLLDIICAGNWFVSEIETPRADAGTGLILMNNGDQSFSALSQNESGFFVPGDVRKLKKSNSAKRFFIANNNGPFQIFDTTH